MGLHRAGIRVLIMKNALLILLTILFLHINKEGTSVITVKEKYGGIMQYDSIALVTDRDNTFYLSSRDKVLAILPKCNYAIIRIEK